jgi:surface antigen
LIASIALMAAAPTLAQEPYWQCARFAREFSGIEIRGDAWTWWSQAEGRYARGNRPQVGAVMSFTPNGPMRLGHVATVTRVLGDREVAVTHANWSPINGTRGQIERDVLIRDVSENNDWSQVRVWYAPIADLGATAWPVDGFIYPADTPKFAEPTLQLASAQMPMRVAPRLSYANVMTLDVAKAPSRGLRLGSDVIRLAMLEARQAR